MAGERLYGEFTDDDGTSWRVSIYDTNPTWNPANATEFALGAEGFVLSYSGNNEQQSQPIIASSCEFTLFEQVSAHTNTLDLLYSQAEGRLLLDVYKDPDGDNTPYWHGVILGEQVERNDEPHPTPIRITATDDLGNLKNIDFDKTIGSISGNTPLKDVIRCLLQTRNIERWSSGEALVRYINDTELYSASDDSDPLNTITTTNLPPQKSDSNGNPIPHNCFDILNSYALCFNARVFQSEGVFWFWPINVHQRVSDGEAISLSVKQYDKTASAVAWTQADITAMNTSYKQISGSNWNKLAGHTFTHLPPVKSVTREQRTNGNLSIVNGTSFNVVTTGQNITLADTDQTYVQGTRFQISGELEFQVDGDSSSFNPLQNVVHIEIEISLNVGNQYYTPEEWGTSSSNKYVIDVATFNRQSGTNVDLAYGFVTDELPSEQDDLDCTAVVKFFNEEGTNVTNDFSGEDFFVSLTINYADGDAGNADLLIFRSLVGSDNVVQVDQGEVLHGDPVGFSSQGDFLNTDNEWKSSQTAGPLPLHRLGVNEALARQKFATKVHRGTVTDIVEMWHTIVEDDEYYVPFEISTVYNRCESTVERYKIAFDSTGITSADDEVRREITRQNLPDAINSLTNAVTQQVQQPKPSAGGTYPDTPTGGRALQTSTSVGPLFHRVALLEHSSGSTHYIQSYDQTYVYMNTYTDTATGYGVIYLPRVGENEGRMFRFKSDGTITANKYYRVGISPTQYTAGVRIDGQSAFDMNRDYDGIAVLCYDGQWYVIQRKSK